MPNDTGESRTWEESEVCSCGLVHAGHPSHAYNEEAFRYLLTLEQKRAERSRNVFLLLLVRPKANHESQGSIDPVLAEAIFSGMSRCVREGDFVGWYSDGRVVGAVLTEGVKTPAPELPGRIARRVTGVLAEELPGHAAIELEVRVYRPHSSEKG